MKDKLISIAEFVDYTKVELTFIDTLEEEGLIRTVQKRDVKYIESEQLVDLERFVRLHYDLLINIEGIDVINNLLKKIGELENEIFLLKQKK